MHLDCVIFGGDEMVIALKNLTTLKYEYVEFDALEDLLKEVSLFKVSS